MASNEHNDPKNILFEKFRLFFGRGDPQKKKDGLPPKTHFSIWYILFAILFISYLQPILFSSKVEIIPYSQFKQSIAKGTVGTAIIEPEAITGTLTAPSNKEFRTVRVDDPGLVEELDERNISYSGRYDNKFLTGLLSWIVPLVFFFFIWRFAMSRMGPGMGVMSFSKSKAKIFAQSDTRVSFTDLHPVELNQRGWLGEGRLKLEPPVRRDQTAQMGQCCLHYAAAR